VMYVDVLCTSSNGGSFCHFAVIPVVKLVSFRVRLGMPIPEQMGRKGRILILST